MIALAGDGFIVVAIAIVVGLMAYALMKLEPRDEWEQLAEDDAKADRSPWMGQGWHP